jgi:sec-independent protein translocase protein TatA
VLLFGNRIPSVMRSLGLGITEFKKGIKGELPDSDDSNEKIEDMQDEQ